MTSSQRYPHQEGGKTCSCEPLHKPPTSHHQPSGTRRLRWIARRHCSSVSLVLLWSCLSSCETLGLCLGRCSWWKCFPRCGHHSPALAWRCWSNPLVFVCFWNLVTKWCFLCTWGLGGAQADYGGLGASSRPPFCWCWYSHQECMGWWTSISPRTRNFFGIFWDENQGSKVNQRTITCVDRICHSRCPSKVVR